MNRGESLQKRRRRESGVSVWGIVGGAVLVLVAVGVITQFHDIRRYWNMTRM
ncbi:MAG: hypothetical protein JOZ02_11230 [Acidobacteria bacterium]|nr:hypothetical protein [Acidobacteriota bacterium]